MNGGGIFCLNNANATFEYCAIVDNYSLSSGGGATIQNCSPTFLNCVFNHNEARGSRAGGLFLVCSNATFIDCDISHNRARSQGGAFFLSSSSPRLERCTVCDDSGNYGGGIYMSVDSYPEIVNCTFSGNYTSAYGGDIYTDGSSYFTAVNTIFEGTLSGGCLYLTSSLNVSLSYCDFHEIIGGLCQGNPLPGLGILTGVNANGDSCDTFMNILLDPLFINPAASNYHLQQTSPCIDAGDPSLPADPDSTIADLGAFYFPQGSASLLIITLTPLNPPIQVPAGGGSFGFMVMLENSSNEPVTFDVWTESTLPGGAVYGPLIQRLGLSIPGGGTVSRRLTQYVPAAAPAGNYIMTGAARTLPDSAESVDSFPFVKLPGESVPAHNLRWAVYGWEDDKAVGGRQSAVGIFNIFPNPFNQTTDIRYQLQAASNIKLAVYDVSGREAAVLAQGFYPAGERRAVFDAAGLSSGVYFARLYAGGSQYTQKLLLMK